jgi:predicted DNA-binding transcriptional regulator AlpA
MTPEPVRYLGVPGLAQRLGVTRDTIYKWRARYPADAPQAFPVPDAEVDDAPAWLPERLDEIMQWRANLPGRGAGGGRRPRQAELS